MRSNKNFSNFSFKLFKLIRTFCDNSHNELVRVLNFV